jgi:putative peptide zinc metalloprotease protein
MVYPLIKTLHEFGHCLAARRYGASVNEVGITLLIFMPVPYVNASAASRFIDKRQRMLVSAAGILVEALLASLALIVWLGVDDGLLRDLSFAVMVVGGISTILFNGNPLLRFDGYFILSDAIEIPDLATRSSRYYAYLCKRYVLGAGTCGYADGLDGERIWFLLYGLLSTAYRLVLSLGIAVFLFHKVPVLGALAAGWLLALQVIFPLLKHGRFLLFDNLLKGRRVSALGRFFTLLLCVFAVVSLPVFPSSTLVYGVVQIPAKSIVRAEVDGFLIARYAHDGQPVKPGDVIYKLENNELATDVAILESRIQELKASRDVRTAANRASYDIHNEHLAEAQSRLVQLKQKLSALVVRSTAAGRLQLFHSEDYLGRYVSQGDEIGWLSDADQTVIRVVASQREAYRIRNDTRKIEVKFINRFDAVYPGYLLEEVPLASDNLPSAALGSRAGGSISVDARDPLGVKSLHRVFTFDVQVVASQSGDFIGSRAMVRFHHRPAAWLTRWYEVLKHKLGGQKNL